MIKKSRILKIVNDRVSKFGKLILLGYSGSISYGLNTKESDIDIVGVFIPKEEYLVSVFKHVEQVLIPKTKIYDKTIEGTIFALGKYLELAYKTNPNILELLFIEKNHLLFQTEDGQKLIQNREMFLTKRVKHSYGGYAFAQLQRMDKINKNVNQNEKRLERIEKYGYDTKNAMHLFRLLETGIEILTEGILHVQRVDAPFLLTVLQGQYTINEIREMANKKMDLLREAYIVSEVPSSLSIEKVEKLYKEMINKETKIRWWPFYFRWRK